MTFYAFLKEGPEHKMNPLRTGSLPQKHKPHVPSLKKKKFKECRNHTTIHLRQRVREQTCQVRAWIGRAGPQQGHNYIQTGARVHPAAQQRTH